MAVEQNSFVHPRQAYLQDRLTSGGLVPGAAELIQEAIEEYQSAFVGGEIMRGNFRSKKDRSVSIRWMNEVEGDSFWRKRKRLSVKFEGELVKDGVDVGANSSFVVVVLTGLNVPGVEVYPDRLRYVELDGGGNSKEVDFLVDMPGVWDGGVAPLIVSVLNGESLVTERVILVESVL